jgi:hypothetical protein
LRLSFSQSKDNVTMVRNMTTHDLTRKAKVGTRLAIVDLCETEQLRRVMAAFAGRYEQDDFSI